MAWGVPLPTLPRSEAFTRTGERDERLRPWTGDGGTSFGGTRGLLLLLPPLLPGLPPLLPLLGGRSMMAITSGSGIIEALRVRRRALHFWCTPMLCCRSAPLPWLSLSHGWVSRDAAWGRARGSSVSIWATRSFASALTLSLQTRGKCRWEYKDSVVRNRHTSETCRHKKE